MMDPQNESHLEFTAQRTPDAENRVEEEGEKIEVVDQKYNSKKPQWWYRVSASTSRAQKRAMRAILTEERRLPKIQYGRFYEWREIFPSTKDDHDDHDIWIELGFGRGENLLALAHRKHNDAVSLIGMEMHQSGVGTTCRRMQKGLEGGQHWTDYTLYSSAMDPNTCPTEGESKIDPEMTEDVPEISATSDPTVDCHHLPKNDLYGNLRLWPGDGVKLFPKIPDSSIACILLTFPDPFPEDREIEWRLIQVSTLREIHRILRKTSGRPFSGRFFLATDHEGYHKWSHDCVNLLNKDHLMLELIEPCPDRLEWLPAVSHYEEKGWNEGRRTQLSCWVAREL